MTFPRMHDTGNPKPFERVILAGVLTGGQSPDLFEIDMKEMAMLCATAGARIVETVTQKREAPIASTFIGSGKLAAGKAQWRQGWFAHRLWIGLPE